VIKLSGASFSAGAGVPERHIGLEAFMSRRLWSNVQTQRALSVEAVLDVANSILWPDSDRVYIAESDDIAATRAQEYSLLATLLTRSPDSIMLGRIGKLHRDETPLGQAHFALARVASKSNAQTIEREFVSLFIGAGRGELFPYSSHYLNEWTPARLREDIRVAGIECVEGSAWPEDHVVTLCGVMARVSGGQFGIAPVQQKLLFERHLSPWIGRFFADLERARSAEFYRHVAAVGRLFIEAEAKCFSRLRFERRTRRNRDEEEADRRKVRGAS
jgi:TorA maturation chaperone TorD